MTNKFNPFLLKTKPECSRWKQLKTNENTLNTKKNEVKHTNDRFKIINEKEERSDKQERYEKRNIFQQTFKSENPERRISKGFLHFTNETKKLEEKKPTTINIEEMSESVLDNEFPTLG